MALLGRTQIDAAEDRKWEDVPVPEWGGEVRIVELTSAQRGYIEAGLIAVKGQAVELRVERLKSNRERTVALALVDENFRPMYSDKEVSKLGEKSGKVIDRLYQVAVRLSGMNPSATAAAEGNSVAAPSGSSDSG